ncbi:quinoprotein relay system zinc metallohydrolase 2 [Rubrimonas cliftonensis]|uniref:Quinoprotein relay system zinc metallohydrolase 2 n=1 Tax=Rubrimonas cliftonensis TaxID=89524 RepID=A0A1H4B3F7_9RHOB|nr:quinoprotein relay system zinc metallohydrolase 2 [Rubrimonas cliftonensis]SEA42568.1 quinoprotein relay system zinc metallohydrolase 2 [Rubrimonas cliftonensis]
MWEVLLTVCMAADPGACRMERLPGGGDRAACVAAADAAVAALPRAEQAQEWPCVPVGETPGFTVTEIAPGVFVHRGRHEEPEAANGGDVSNAGFVIGGEAVAVIDAGGAPGVARSLLAEIRARTDLPVRWLILTHMHPDHVLGAGVFVDAGARVTGAERLGPALAARAQTYMAAMSRLLGPAFEDARIVSPDEGVATTREIDLGGRTLVLRAHPVAHTDNDLSVRDIETGTLFLGDLLFMGHVPALDGSLLGWRRELAALVEAPAKRVVPGHGPAAAAWPDAAGPITGYLDTLIADTRAAIAAGEPMLGATERIGQGARDGWLLFDAFNTRNATAAYQQLEWE